MAPERLTLVSSVALMYFARAVLLALIVVCVLGAQDGLAGRRSVLVVLRSQSQKGSSSIFFQSLEKRGYSLTFVSEKDSIKDVLKKYGEYQFGNLIVLTPQASSIGGLKTDFILEYLDNGGNVLLALDSHPSGFMKYFAGQCGVEVDDKAEFVVDHFHSLAPQGSFENNHTLIQSDEFLENSVIFPRGCSTPFAFEGVPMKVNDGNYLNVALLRAESTAYSGVPGSPVESEPFATGRNIHLVTSMQGENNARVTFVGSLSSLEDSLSAHNLEFLMDVATWTFHERGVLRAHNIRHQRVDGSLAEIQLKQPDQADLPESMFPMPEVAPNSLFYRILDNVSYSVAIDSYSEGAWSPFLANDVQLEFVMMDPYVRKYLDCNFGNYSTSFTIPDVYGIYKFHVQYRRQGYTTLSFDTEVSVRPFRHNEYERFIGAATPYYTGVFALMIGFFVFGFVYLYK